MKIIVLIKQVPDTWGDRRLDLMSGRLARGSSETIVDEIGERALEAALLYQDSDGAEVVAMTMGPATAEQALRKALAMGADSAAHVVDDLLVGSDLARTARVLARAIDHTGFDLVVCGNESTDGRGGMIPAMIAEHLSLPHLTFLSSLNIDENSVSGERATEGGTIEAHAPLPAIVSVTERSPEPRFPGFRGIMKAKKKPIVVLSFADLGLGPAPAGARSVVLAASERPPRASGRTIVDDGSAAVELAEFLAENRLI